jgi:hypothetical protein
LVTVLTPATTFTVGLNCSQKARAVKRGDKIFPEYLNFSGIST